MAEKKKIAFVKEVEQVLSHLTRLKERADVEDSQFKYKIDTAHNYINDIIEIYNEVLNRDFNEDYNHRPKPKEVKND